MDVQTHTVGPGRSATMLIDRRSGLLSSILLVCRHVTGHVFCTTGCEGRGPVFRLPDVPQCSGLHNRFPRYCLVQLEHSDLLHTLVLRRGGSLQRCWRCSPT